jgi:plasmid stabilization system protein ParE
MAELSEAEALIGENPELFRKVRGEARRVMLHKFPFGVFYIARSEFVSVVAVMHHARDPRHWQRRA